MPSRSWGCTSSKKIILWLCQFAGEPTGIVFLIVLNPSCSKSGDIIEPVMKPQWWVNCKPLADEAIKVYLFARYMHTDN